LSYKLGIRTEEIALTKSTVVQIVMVSGKYEIWGCLLCQNERCLLYKTDAAEFSKVFIANGEHDIGRNILSQSKKRCAKNFLGVLPQTFFLSIWVHQPFWALGSYPLYTTLPEQVSCITELIVQFSFGAVVGKVTFSGYNNCKM